MQRSSKRRPAFIPEKKRDPDAAEAIPVFEESLARDPRWALSEGSKFFEGQGAVQETLLKIATRLRDLGIPYAVVGGMALFNHGLRRFTEDVDLLVTRAALKEIHQRLEGLGYLPPFSHSKNLRDTETGVKIEFLVTGDFPGDGKPKPVAFPDPAAVSEVANEICYVNLPTLIELKIASGMTSTERMKDLADVQELIKILHLPLEFAAKLDPYVQEKYRELWIAARPPQKRYVQIWRNKFLTVDAKNVDDMIAALQQAAATLQAMLADGVTLDPAGRAGDDFAYLVTTDPDVAKKYDMHEESEYLHEADNDHHEED
jgi:hypothetical protein